MIRTFGGVTGLTNQPQGLDLGIGGGNFIKSTQRGAFALGVASGTVPISAVNPNNCILEFTWFNNPINPANEVCPSGELTNATTLTFAKSSTAGSTSIEWVVYEFNGVKSKQSGSFTGSGTSFTATISAVDPAKTRVFASWSTTSTNAADVFVNYTLTNSTTITFKQQPTVSRTVKWQVIEFM